MGYNADREQFVAQMSREGMPMQTIRALLRYASTLQRLAVASCNGDWPADNGERKTIECRDCQAHWVPSSFKRPAPYWTYKVCPECYASAKVHAALPDTWRAITGGDPRGYAGAITP
jgi:hypothetical protein